MRFLSDIRATRTLRSFAAFLMAAFAYVPVGAQGTSAYVDVADNWLRKSMLAQQGGDATDLRMEVVVGSLDSRLRLAPCGIVEPYLPVGVRLWGKTQVGLRCVDGLSRWNVMLPVTVNAYGPAWVVKGQVPAGTVLTDSDVVSSEVNWAEDTNPVLQERGAWVGQVATRVLTTGQVLRMGMVKPAQVFQAGASIRVVAQGAGFLVTADAQALSAGIVGQVARVRMENGRVSTGVVLDGKTVKMDL